MSKYLVALPTLDKSAILQWTKTYQGIPLVVKGGDICLDECADALHGAHLETRSSRGIHADGDESRNANRHISALKDMCAPDDS